MNKGKSQIFFFTNVLDELSSAICRKIEFAYIDDLGSNLACRFYMGELVFIHLSLL